MSDSETDGKSPVSTLNRLKLPKLSYKGDFHAFHNKFILHADTLNLADAIRGTDDDLPTSEKKAEKEPDKEKKKKMKKAIRRNRDALTMLSSALPEEYLYMIEDTVDDEHWPFGVAHLVYAALKDELQPSDTMARIEANRELQAQVMSAEDKPSNFYHRLKHVSRKYGSAGGITDDQIKTMFIAKCPQALLSHMATVLSGNPSISAKDLANQLNVVWRLGAVGKGDESTVESKSERTPVGLTTIVSPETKNDTAVCPVCKDPNHDLSACPIKQMIIDEAFQTRGSNPRRFQGTCHCCGMKGHKEETCWYKEENAHLRPLGWKPKEGVIKSTPVRTAQLRSPVITEVQPPPGAGLATVAFDPKYSALCTVISDESEARVSTSSSFEVVSLSNEEVVESMKPHHEDSIKQATDQSTENRQVNPTDISENQSDEEPLKVDDSNFAEDALEEAIELQYLALSTIHSATDVAASDELNEEGDQWETVKRNKRSGSSGPKLMKPRKVKPLDTSMKYFSDDESVYETCVEEGEEDDLDNELNGVAMALSKATIALETAQRLHSNQRISRRNQKKRSKGKCHTVRFATTEVRKDNVASEPMVTDVEEADIETFDTLLDALLHGNEQLKENIVGKVKSYIQLKRTNEEVERRERMDRLRSRSKKKRNGSRKSHQKYNRPFSSRRATSDLDAAVNDAMQEMREAKVFRPVSRCAPMPHRRDHCCFDSGVTEDVFTKLRRLGEEKSRKDKQKQKNKARRERRKRKKKLPCKISTNDFSCDPPPDDQFTSIALLTVDVPSDESDEDNNNTTAMADEDSRSSDDVAEGESSNDEAEESTSVEASAMHDEVTVCASNAVANDPTLGVARMPSLEERQMADDDSEQLFSASSEDTLTEEEARRILGEADPEATLTEEEAYRILAEADVIVTRSKAAEKRRRSELLQPSPSSSSSNDEPDRKRSANEGDEDGTRDHPIEIADSFDVDPHNPPSDFSRDWRRSDPSYVNYQQVAQVMEAHYEADDDASALPLDAVWRVFVNGRVEELSDPGREMQHASSMADYHPAMVTAIDKALTHVLEGEEHVARDIFNVGSIVVSDDEKQGEDKAPEKAKSLSNEPKKSPPAEEENQSDDESESTSSTGSNGSSTSSTHLIKGSTSKLALMTIVRHKTPFGILTEAHIWTLDLGASDCFGWSDAGAINCRTAKGSVMMAQKGATMELEKIFDLPGTIYSQDNVPQSKALIPDIKHTPTSKFNLLAISAFLENGWKLTINRDHGAVLTAPDGRHRIVFDIKVPVGNGYLHAVKILPDGVDMPSSWQHQPRPAEMSKTEKKSACMAATTSPTKPTANEIPTHVREEILEKRGRRKIKSRGKWKRRTLTGRKAHRLYGHINRSMAVRIGKHFGDKIARDSLQDKAVICVPCNLARMRRRALPQHDESKEATGINERVSIDICPIKIQKNAKRKVTKYWAMCVDHATGFKKSVILKRKKDLGNTMCEWFAKCKARDIEVKYVRMDNAGENTAFAKLLGSEKWKLYPTIEFTAPFTPQQNSIVEVGFSTLINRMKAIMEEANVPAEMKGRLVGQCIMHCTLLDNLTLIDINGEEKSRYEHFLKEYPEFVHYLHEFGEAAVVHNEKGIEDKQNNKGKLCIYVGVTEEHPADCATFYNPKSGRCLYSRNSAFTGTMFFRNEDASEAHVDIPPESNSRSSSSSSSIASPPIISTNHATPVHPANLSSTEEPIPSSIEVPEAEVSEQPQGIGDNPSTIPSTTSPDTGTKKANAHETDTGPPEDAPDEAQQSTDESVKDAVNEQEDAHSYNSASNDRSSLSSDLSLSPEKKAPPSPTGFRYKNSRGRAVHWPDKYKDDPKKFKPPVANIAIPTNPEDTCSNIEIEQQVQECVDLLKVEPHPRSDDDLEDMSIVEMPELELRADSSDDEDGSNCSDDSSWTDNEDEDDKWPDECTYHDLEDTTGATKAEDNINETNSPDCVYIQDPDTQRMYRTDDKDTLVALINAGLLDHTLDPLYVALVGASNLGDNVDAKDLKPKTFNEALRGKDGALWTIEVRKELQRFLEMGTIELVPLSDVPKHAKILTNVWSMKPKANGTKRARLNMRGFEQREGEHYHIGSISAPVATDSGSKALMVLKIAGDLYMHIVDVKGAFLLGRFDAGEELFSYIPQGWAPFLPADHILKLKRTIYGLKQAANVFWRLLNRTFKAMGFTKNPADQCMWFKLGPNGYLIITSHVDDLCLYGNKEDVLQLVQDLQKGEMELDDVGEAADYLGCQLIFDEDGKGVRYKQEVLIENIKKEFDLPKRAIDTPAAPGVNLVPKTIEDRKPTVAPNRLTSYRAGVGKLLYLEKSRVDLAFINNVLARCTRFCTEQHYLAMLRVMSYVHQTEDRGLYFRPNRSINLADPELQLIIRARSDSNYAADGATRRSTSGYVVYLEDCPVVVKSRLQKVVALSVTEAELMAMVHCAQELLQLKMILEGLDLKVKLPILIESDNKGAVDLVNGFRTGLGSKHIEVKYMRMREWKEDGILAIRWISTKANEADICTKNVDTKTYLALIPKFVGKDRYMRSEVVLEQGGLLGQISSPNPTSVLDDVD